MKIALADVVFFSQHHFLLFSFFSFFSCFIMVTMLSMFRQDGLFTDIILYLSRLFINIKKYDNENRIISNNANKLLKMCIRYQYMINFFYMMLHVVLRSMQTSNHRNFGLSIILLKTSTVFYITFLGFVRRNLTQGFSNRFSHFPLGKCLVPRIKHGAA